MHMDVYDNIQLEWHSSDNAGRITAATGNLSYSGLGQTDGLDNGLCPEDMLIAAISSSYSIMLADALRAASLPQSSISVRAEGVIASELGRARFSRVTVNPVIRGADILRRDAYEKMAIAARDDCLIGRSIRGNVAYVVGEVVLSRLAQ